MILYFSGTGNSLSVARVLAEETGDSLCHMADVLPPEGTRGTGEGPVMVPAKVIGLVFPVYYNDVPDAVREFLDHVRFDPSSYIYAAVTCGGSAGNTLSNLDRILQRRGCRLAYGKPFFMIANSTATCKKQVTYDYSRLETARREARDMAAAVRSRTTDRSALRRSLAATVMSSSLSRALTKGFLQPSVNPSACVHCGVCVRVCPNHNITEQEGKIVLGSHCTQCLACAYWCPHGGIAVHGRVIPKENLYHHPDVRLQDMFRR